MKKAAAAPRQPRYNKGRWKRIYGTDRKYTARVDHAIARGQYTEPHANTT